jgi:FAD/FMN-containing dehydrogenase
LNLEQLQQRIREAAACGTALCIRGGGSKDFYGNAPRGEPLDTRGCAGIVAYEPTELVLTARGGTSLAEIEKTLAENGQMLAFEPPHFGPGATLGGCVAAGLSGPRRAASGSVRDAMLGAKILDGRGQLLAFGGQVMKNVAGYDVSRLLAGSLGVLGAICEVSLKVLPAAPDRATLAFEWDEARALEQLNRWAGQPLPLNAGAWHQGRLYLRLAGARAAVRAARERLGGTLLEAGEAAAWWESVRDHRHAFFTLTDAELAAGECLWRLSVPPAVPPFALPGTGPFIEWGGAQRWWRTRAPAEPVRAAAGRAGGHATLFRAADKSAGVFAPLAPALARIHRRLKQAFDPAGVFNPGRLYPDL